MKSVRCCPFLFDVLWRLYLLFLFFPIWAFISPPMTSRLCFGMLRTREDSSLMGLPLNVAAIILGCILSMLSIVFKALDLISIPIPPTVAFTEFFHADTVASVHPLPVSWYLISSVWVYRCSCMQIMSILCSTADAVSSGRWPILFRVLTLNVAICIVCLHFSSFCLSSVADFSNTEARAPTSAGRVPFLPVRRAMRFMYGVWLWVMVIFRWLFLFSSIEATLIDEQQ